MVAASSHAEGPPRPARLICDVSDAIPAQVAFWQDAAPVRAFVGGVGSGKTFAGALACLMMPAGTVGLVAAPTYPMLRDATQRTFFEICPPELIQQHHKSEQRTELATGTTILWRSTDNPDRLRGPNLAWLWADEAAYMTETAWRVLVSRLRKRPAKAWITTTPRGHNWLHRWCCVLQNGYSLHHAHTNSNPFNAPGFAEGLARQYSHDQAYLQQELAGAFVDLSGSKRIPSTLLESVYQQQQQVAWHCSHTIKGHRQAYSLPASLRVYELPEAGARYVIGADCAEGVRGGDDSTCVVVRADTGQAVAILAGEFEPAEEHAALLALLAKWYHQAPALIERNNHGHAVLASAARHGVVCLRGPDGRPGWQTTAISKAQAWGEAHSVVLDAAATGMALLPDRKLREQIGSVDRVTLKGPGKGRITKVDDEAVAWVLAQQARKAAPLASARSRQAMARLMGRGR